MAVYINRAALSATRLQSSSLGPVDSIGHPLLPGKYYGVVSLKNVQVGTIAVEVNESGSGEQIDIDLATATAPGPQSAALRTGLASKDTPVFAVFHSTGAESGYHVTLTPSGGRRSVFDSRSLGKGDYYILTPLKPGTWTLSTPKGAKGLLVVSQAAPTDKPRPSSQGAMIRTDGKSFDPRESRLVSGDGVVFEVTGDDVEIEVTLDEQEPSGKGKRPVGVRYPGPAFGDVED